MDLGQLIPHSSLLPELVPNGWNALLWGRPGTGKTQLACLLAEMVKMTLYTLRSHDDDSSLRRHGSQSRLSELLLAQRLLARNGSCIPLVDEGTICWRPGRFQRIGATNCWSKTRCR